MSLSQTHILEVIRAHPEGITNIELARIISEEPRSPSYFTVRNKVTERCHSLEKFGLIRRKMVSHVGKGPCTICSWTAVIE